MIQIKGIFILKILHFSFCTDKLSRHLSNSSISSVSTNSSALPYSTPLSPEAYLASLPSSVPARPEDEMETNSIASINSEMSTNTLRNNNHQQQLIIIKNLSAVKPLWGYSRALVVEQTTGVVVWFYSILGIW